MNDYGMKIDAGVLRIQRLLPGPIDRVWAYLTESDKRETWLAAGEMQLKEGGTVELQFHNAKLAGKDEIPPTQFQECAGEAKLPGKIVSIFPPHTLSFTWADKGQERPSIVTFELKEQGQQVLLTVTHCRLTDRDMMLSVASGWHIHLDLLVARLGEQQPPPFWATLSQLAADYQAKL